MGLIISLFYTPAKDTSFEDAIQRLREAQESLQRTLDHRERRIRDCQRDAAQLSLDARTAHRKLTPVEKSKARNILKRKILFERRYERFSQILNNLELQLASLEDVPMITETVQAMRAGTKAHSKHSIDISEIERVLETIAEQEEDAADKAALLADRNFASTQIDSLTDESLQADLEQLLSELEQEQASASPQAPALPSVPEHSLSEEQEIALEAQLLL